MERQLNFDMKNASLELINSPKIQLPRMQVMSSLFEGNFTPIKINEQPEESAIKVTTLDIDIEEFELCKSSSMSSIFQSPVQSPIA